jgi:hypothetical protein
MPTDSAEEAFVLRGAGLPDPQRLLKGSGKVARHVVLDDAAALDQPAVQELIAMAAQRAEKPLDTGRRGPIVIKSVSENQRPRRPSAKKSSRGRRAPQ